MNLLELVGVIMGDGCLVYFPKKKVYTLEIAGNSTEEWEYYTHIKNFLEKITKHKANLSVRKHKLGKSLRLTLHSKNFLEYLMTKLGLHSPKSFSVKIPEKYTSWIHAKHIIRGIFESDGSLYFSRIYPNKKHTYPRLEIKTNSKVLAKQLIRILLLQQFKVHVKRSRSDKTFAVYLSGSSMLEKWNTYIGFSSEKNKTKYELWKNTGFYTPRLSLADRQKCLGSWLAGT